ncbi:exopolysaccharide biosynthesis polyprenyl glycosylphosphotransferase [Bradyrhizobium sp. AZCC 1693]|uniref:exopolysaccharide biosynthesis polyprenyl glycosylphosphotransferase n=1 Tax=Bradyrhizobium sp. AZCC 1693 TaxID=3117029 RepID=UPI002FF2470A
MPSAISRRHSGVAESTHTWSAAASRIAYRRRRATSLGLQAKLAGPNRAIKRVFDVMVSLITVVALSPLLFIAAVAVKVDTPGPIIFLQWRGGRSGRPFRIVKFRTMICMEDGFAIRQARPGDTRVTRVGRVLRRYSVDELPQLFNVLRGDMSLVGPRPHALSHDATYLRLVAAYSDRQLVRPGMTGWAQVNGCRGETRDATSMQRRVEHDLDYIRHWSLWFDLKIMAKTVTVVFRPNEAY